MKRKVPAEASLSVIRCGTVGSRTVANRSRPIESTLAPFDAV